MATLKKKINELTQKENPVLGDSIVISDSENSGRGALVEITDIQTLIGGGGGAVDSVAGKTGAVTLDASDISETETLKIFTATERIKLTGIAEGANNYTHPASHPQSMIEGLDDALAGKAPLDSPVFTGNPRAPDAPGPGTSSSRIANCRFVQAQKESPDLTGTPTAPTAAAGTNTTQLATTAFVQAATANAIYDLPVTRSGLVAPGTDAIIFETANEIDPAWYDATHVLNVSFFARNDSGVSDNTTFKVQLYDAGTSTAHTIASITADTLDCDLLQAYICMGSSSSVNCNIQYGYVSSYGYVSLASGSYKLRVVCTSTLSTIFAAAQVRFTK